MKLFADFEGGKMTRDPLIKQDERIAAVCREKECHLQLSLATNLDVFKMKPAEFVSQSGKAS